MKPFRKRNDAWFGRERPGRNRLEKSTLQTRMEAKEAVQARRKRERDLKIRKAVQKRAERMERLEARARAGRGATWRLLRPVFAVGHLVLVQIAPFVSRGLMTAARIPVAAIATLVDFSVESARSLRNRLGPVLAGFAELVQRKVTPVNTTMVVALACAVALGVSQFIDYSGIAVGEPLYQGDAANVAPVPLTEVEKLGSAHYYLMLPLAIVAGWFIIATRRGRWRYGRLVALIGVIGILVTLLIDRPQALDAGPIADAYAGSAAKLLDGYWAQLFASAGLVLFGPLLGTQVRREAGGDRGARRRSRTRRRLQRKKFVGAAHRREVGV